MAAPTTSTPSVLSASRAMASGTIVSRITGLLRSTLLVAAIGKGIHADVFNVANTIPNSLYILVAGGIFNAVLVPQLVRAIKNDADGGDAYANRIITLGALVLTAVTAVLVIFAPLLLRLLASGYFTDPSVTAERDSLITFARYCLPQVFFYGMFVLIGQVLNARGKFGPMMWTPIANNIISIAILGAYLGLYGGQGPTQFTTFQELLLGVGSTIGIAVQALLLLPYLRQTGFRIRPRTDFRGTGLGHTMGIAKWTVGFVVVNQVAFYVMVHQSTSATAQDANGSGYTVYQNAFLLTQVPHSIVTVSLATATIPLVSRLAADGRIAEMATEMSQSLRLVLSVIVPFAVGLGVLGPQLATVMFSWGAARGQTSGLGTTIIAFAPGVLMFSIHYMILRGFYALEDTRTAFYVQCVVAAVNVAFAIGLTSIAGPNEAAPMLALAYGASYTAGALLSTTVLSRRLGGLGTSGLVRFIVRVAAAALPSAAVIAAIVWAFDKAGVTAAGRLDSLIVLLVGGALGGAAYLLLARALHLTEITRIIRMLRPGSRDDSRSHDEPGPPPTMVPSRPQQATPASGDRGEAGSRDVGGPPVEPGTVLADRYALEDQLSEEGDSTTWRARDRVLARSVVLQIMASSAPAAAEMLSTAKQASRVADPRVLQVLDALDDGEFSYVVREWASGQSLEVVLAEGPMSARRATFLVREVAGAISTAHNVGLRHRRLGPDTVVLTKSSGVKILGLGMLPPYHTDPDEVSDPELADARDLGRLLYTCLTARWPGDAPSVLPPAPTEHGRLLRPRQVRAGVPRALDSLCDRILGQPPRNGEPITSVDEIKAELNTILTSDGYGESATLSGERTDPAGQQPPPPEPPPAVIPTDEGPTTGEIAAATDRPPLTERTVRRTLGWVVLLLLSIGVLLTLFTLAAMLGAGHGHTATTPTQSQPQTQPTKTHHTKTHSPPPATLTPIQVVGVKSFDPPPQGSGDENPDEAPYAIDGDPRTAWRTLTYYGGATFGGLKQGVGLVLDLGSVQEVRKVDVTLVGSPTTLELRAASASASGEPAASANDYTLVATTTANGTHAVFSLTKPVSTRYLLVWLTSLPKVDDGYQGQIAEIKVLG